MIPVPFNWFVFLYLAVFLCGILILWMGYAWKCARAAKRDGRMMILCRICGSRYVPAQSLSECPACGSRNERPADVPVGPL
jgi:hypothetical protein